jgi:hypothetical protein
VILPPQVDSVDIHASVVGPVVRQRNYQLHADFRRRVDDFVEACDVDRRFAIGAPALEDNFRGPGAFAAVLRQAGRVVSSILFVESPRAEHFEAGFFGGGEAEFGVGLGVGEGEVLVGCRMLARCGSLAGFGCKGDSHVGVAAGEVEVLSIQLEFRSGSRYEAFGGFAGEC